MVHCGERTKRCPTFNVKIGKNSIFLKNGKTVILVGIRKFSRSRMTEQTSLLNSFRESVERRAKPAV